MNWGKVVLIIISFALVCSSCTPISQQVEELVDDSLPGSNEDEGSDRNTDDEQNTLSDQSIHGFGMGSSAFMRVGDLDQAYKDMADMGVKYVREEFRWDKIQSDITSHSFNFNGGYDLLINAARENNLAVVALLTYGPSAGYGDDLGFIELWAAYVQAVVDRYGNDIDYWEIGNEMNVLSFWRKVRPGAQSIELDIYGRMLDRAYEIIKSDDPEDVVVLGGLIAEPGGHEDEFIPPLLFVKELGKYTSRRSFDAVGLHVYWGDLMPETPKPQLIAEEYQELSMPGYVALFAQDIERMYDGTVPIWITEVGYDWSKLQDMSSVYDMEHDSLQAVALARTYTALLSIPQVKAVFWYTYAHDGQNYEDYTLRPIGKVVYKSIASALTGAAPLGPHTIVDDSDVPVENTYEYRFLKPSGNTVSVFWKNKPEILWFEAVVTDLEESPATKYEIDDGLDNYGVEIDESASINIMEIPRILIGAMDQDTRLVVTSVPEPTSYTGKGQIAYTINGNVYYQNLETGFNIQITSDADAEQDFRHVYKHHEFSPSGHYLAYEYGNTWDGSIMTIVIDLVEMQEIKRFEGDMLLGWLYNEDVLRYGHNAKACPEYDPQVTEDDNAFIVSEYNAVNDSVTTLVTIPGVWRLPSRVITSQNLMSFQPCSCTYFECAIVDEVYTSQGEFFYEAHAFTAKFSQDLQKTIDIRYNYHGPESGALEIIDLNTGVASEVYYEEGRFPSSAFWGKDDAWIFFWLGDAGTFEFRTKFMKVRPDGSDAEEISPMPKRVLGSYPDGRLMLIPKSLDRILLFDTDTGETETLATLDSDVNTNSMIWEKLP